MEILADATNIIAEGEVLQLMNVNDPDTTEQKLSAGYLLQNREVVRGSHSIGGSAV